MKTTRNTESISIARVKRNNFSQNGCLTEAVESGKTSVAEQRKRVQEKRVNFGGNTTFDTSNRPQRYPSYRRKIKKIAVREVVGGIFVYENVCWGR